MASDQWAAAAVLQRQHVRHLLLRHALLHCHPRRVHVAVAADMEEAVIAAAEDAVEEDVAVATVVVADPIRHQPLAAADAQEAAEAGTAQERVAGAQVS